MSGAGLGSGIGASKKQPALVQVLLSPVSAAVVAPKRSASPPQDSTLRRSALLASGRGSPCGGTAAEPEPR